MYIFRLEPTGEDDFSVLKIYMFVEMLLQRPAIFAESLRYQTVGIFTAER